MFASQVLAVLALAGIATSQGGHGGSGITVAPFDLTSTSTSASSSTTTSSASGPATSVVLVGAQGFVFSPNEIHAQVGDIIRFAFYPGGHRVARAEFKWPCIPYEYSNPNKPGFSSGDRSPQVVLNDPPHFDVRVNDTDPIFFYCYAPTSCVTHHMIGVINPNETETLDAQLAYAQNVTYQLGPGDPFPTETDTPRPTAGTSSTSSSSSSSGSSSNLSPGAIAGIAIGAAAVVIIAAALIYLCGRRGGFDKAYRKSAQAPPAGPSASPPLVEAKYANAASGLHDPLHPALKSPGQTTLASFGDVSTLRNSAAGGGGYGPYGQGGAPSPHLTSTPSPGVGGGYGYAVGHGHAHGHGHGHGHAVYGGEGIYPSPHAPSPPPGDQYTPFIPQPVELPTGETPAQTQSPPPGYRGRDSWVGGQEGQYRPGAKP